LLANNPRSSRGPFRKTEPDLGRGAYRESASGGLDSEFLTRTG